MSYQVKRIDPYWLKHPIIPVVAVAGAIGAALGYQSEKAVLSVAGLVFLGAAVLAAAKPVISAVLGTLGLFGGLVTFVLLPNPQMVGMAFPLKLLSTVLFGALYMVLMDALVLAVAFLYNLFGTGMRGISIDIEEAAGEEA
ncbi:MAG: hypothetical protein HY554_04385 [Elusimicrobia bacterium]|nr:hypothetical protein [Elusimicrobiota bacterium]